MGSRVVQVCHVVQFYRSLELLNTLKDMFILCHLGNNGLCGNMSFYFYQIYITPLPNQSSSVKQWVYVSINIIPI